MFKNIVLWKDKAFINVPQEPIELIKEEKSELIILAYLN